MELRSRILFEVELVVGISLKTFLIMCYFFILALLSNDCYNIFQIVWC